MQNAADALSTSLGTAGGWEGEGADAHAARAQALATAHQVGSEALLAGSQALSAYARDLAEAQALATQAGAAAAVASGTAGQLAAINTLAGTASTMPANPYLVGRFGDFGPGQSPAAADQAQANRLQWILDDQNSHAAALANQAVAAASAAASRAAAAFSAVAALAGNNRYRGSTDPIVAYLGVPSTAAAATLTLQAGTTQAGGSGAQLAAAAVLDAPPETPSAAEEAEIRTLESKLWQSPPAGFDSWPPDDQVAWVKQMNHNEQSLADAELGILLGMGVAASGGDDEDGEDEDEDGGGEVDGGGEEDSFGGVDAAILGGSDDNPPDLDPGGDSFPLAPNGGLPGNEGPDGVGGHTLARHVNMSLDDLNARLDESPWMEAASVYTNEQTAEAATANAIAARREEIDTWLSGSKRRLELKWDAPDEVGIALLQNGRQVVGIQKILVWLQRSDNSPAGYYIVTSYPNARG